MDNQNQTTATPPEGRPLGIDEAAEYTGLSRRYLYKLVYLGKVPHYKPTGGRLYFKRADLDAFVFRGRRAADFELREQAEKIMAGGGNERVSKK